MNYVGYYNHIVNNDYKTSLVIGLVSMKGTTKKKPLYP